MKTKTVDINKFKADNLFKKKMAEWGERPGSSLPATVDEIQIFLLGGAQSICLNRQHEDGIFFHKIAYYGQHFLAISEDKFDFFMPNKNTAAH